MHRLTTALARVVTSLVPSAAVLSVACSGPPAPPIKAAPPPSTTTTAPSSTIPSSTTPSSTTPPVVKGVDPFALPSPLVLEDFSIQVEPGPEFDALVLPPTKVTGDDGYTLQAPSAACHAFVQRKPAKAPSCNDAGTGLAALDDAFSKKDPAIRDAALAGLEACAGIPAGVVRALRAEVAPSGCGDLLTEPSLADKKIAPAIRQVLFALALSARLSRAVPDPPPRPKLADMDDAAKYVKGPLTAWIKQSTNAISAFHAPATKLTFYARALGAASTASAWLGMYDKTYVSGVAVGVFSGSKAEVDELRRSYNAVLVKALEPFSAQALDAGTNALKNYADVGSIADARLESTRKAMSKHWKQGNPFAPGNLLTPAAPPPAPLATKEQRLAVALPTYYAGLLLDPALASDDAWLAAAAGRGIPFAHRKAYRAIPAPSVDGMRIMIRHRLATGSYALRAADFDEVASLASHWREIDGATKGEGTFYLALGLALHGGPENLAAYWKTKSFGTLGDITALDAFSSAMPADANAGFAMFDAAFLKGQFAKDKTEALYRDVAKRYTKAADLLADAKQRDEAKTRAKDSLDAAEFTKASTAAPKP